MDEGDVPIDCERCGPVLVHAGNTSVVLDAASARVVFRCPICRALRMSPCDVGRVPQLRRCGARMVTRLGFADEWLDDTDGGHADLQPGGGRDARRRPPACRIGTWAQEAGRRVALALDDARPGLDLLASARRVVREVTRDGPHPDDHVELVALVVSELLANAILHGRPPLAVSVAQLVDGTSVTVSDGERGTALRLPESPCRGLSIVDRVSNGVSVERTDDGKTVQVFIPL